MRWSERQRAMLREMGIPAFWPVEPLVSAGTADVEAPAMAPHATPSAPALPVERPAERPAVRPSEVRSPAAVPPVSAAREPVESVAPVSAQGLTWEALQEAVRSCQACALSASRTQAVLGAGPAEADWLIVVEAPGEAEDAAGEPLVGRAAELLARMLEAVGLSRDGREPGKRVYVTNAVKCRPPGSRNVLPAELGQCQPYLQRQIELIQPRVILAMGRAAVHALLQTREPLGTLRGRAHQAGGVPVVVTYHPSSLLRTPADKALAWDDLCLAKELADRG